MKITIKEAKGHSIHIVFPTWLAFRPTMIQLCLRIARKNCPGVPYISKNTLRPLSRAIKEAKGRYRRYELVDIESNDGDVVKLVL